MTKSEAFDSIVDMLEEYNIYELTQPEAIPALFYIIGYVDSIKKMIEKGASND